MQEFNIFLNKRFIKSDLIVSSLKYRDMITAINNVIIKSNLDCLLEKSIPISQNAEISTHISKTLKKCYTHSLASLPLSVNISGLCYNIFESGSSAIHIDSSLSSAYLRKYRLNSDMDLFDLQFFDNNTLSEIDFVILE